MKRLIKILSFLMLLLNWGGSIGQTTASVNSNLLESQGIMPITKMEMVTSQQSLRKIWINEPIPLSFYTEEEKEIQKLLNDREDKVIAYSPDKKPFTRDIDQEDITPITWKWVHFEIKEKNGGYTKAHLRRPTWWLKKVGATEIGKTVPLSMYEIGVEGIGTVINISANQLDTRLWDLNRNGDYVSRPITGKVEHYANNVLELHFDNSTSSPLAVTANHLIWSHDRNNWFRVDAIRIGERIKTQRGNVIVTKKIPKAGWFVVFDLEVYRDHNFFVGAESILAHNGCIDDILALRKSGNLAGFHKKLSSFNFGNYLEKTLGVAKPSGMVRPHAHHIVMKKGGGEWGQKSRALLEKYGIDPYFGKENLTWAPNGMGNHSNATAKKVYDTLKAAESGGKNSIKEALESLGTKMSNGEFK